MTDRYVAFTVVLEREIREDDAQPIVDALKMIKGVLSVEPVVAEAMFYSAREQARHELGQQLWDALHPKKGT